MKGNIYAAIPVGDEEEWSEDLLSLGSLRIERIVSTGQTSPPGFWYDQEWDEWVVLLAGGASIAFEGEPSAVTLQKGDFVHIPAHRRHRVERTEKGVQTVWLAIHFPS